MIGQSKNFKGKNVPKWEKRFVLLVGRMEWREFLKAKSRISELDSVMKWDDVAGKEAFYAAKRRFWSTNGGPPFRAPLPSPDMYIDQVDWNVEVDPGLIKDLEEARECKEFKELPVLMKDMKPTGWDEVYEEGLFEGRNFYGLIIGEKGSEKDLDVEPKLVDKSIVQDVINDGVCNDDKYNGGSSSNTNFKVEENVYDDHHVQGGNKTLIACSSSGTARKPRYQRSHGRHGWKI